MTAAITAITRIGTRAMNQDRLGHWSSGEATLLAVADGMGGHPRGELAAQLAVDVLAEAFAREARPALPDPGAFLVAGFLAAHRAIVDAGRELGLYDSPRTVLVACVVQHDMAHWLHIGDARLYLVREGRTVARTRDHTFVQALVDAGRIREEAVGVHPERNMVLQCLGGDEWPGLDDLGMAGLEHGDVVLLCSDGLWGPLSERQIVGALIGRDPVVALPELAEVAERRAGAQCDNVTALALRCDDSVLRGDPQSRDAPQDRAGNDSR